MEPRLSFVSLGVRDLPRAIRFYEGVLQLPRIPMPEEADIAFFELGKTWLGLYPRDLLAADVGVPEEGQGLSRVTLAHSVAYERGVDALLEEIARAGGRIVKPGKR